MRFAPFAALLALLVVAHAWAQKPAPPTRRDAGTPAVTPPPPPEPRPLDVVSLVPPTTARVTTWATPPFDAWVDDESRVVLPSPEQQWPSLGVLLFGDVVHVTGCTPACDDPDAFATLEPFGVVRLRYLRPMPRTDNAIASGPGAQFRFARVTGRDVSSHVRPDLGSDVVRRFSTGDEIFLRPATSEPDGEFLIRPDGSYIRASDVRMFTLSTLAGWHDPPTRFAFAVGDTVLTRPDGTTTDVHRYDRFTYLGQGHGVVRVEGGTIPWTALRLGRARRRPASVPSSAKWTHVDLRQQVLTAYEGDRMVFATLISAGLHQGTTQPGHFRVVRKALFTTMKASATEESSYYVEGVQWTQFFHGSVAFHTAYWHDAFGNPRSHGCVNLSPNDARWLFEWSPGDLPEGWRVVNPLAARLDSLYVHVERARP